jgi:hypothetical protein
MTNQNLFHLFIVSYWLILLLCLVSYGGEYSSNRKALCLPFQIPKIKEDVWTQCLDNKVAALTNSLIDLELHPLLLETNKRKL